MSVVWYIVYIPDREEALDVHKVGKGNGKAFAFG